MNPSQLHALTRHAIKNNLPLLILGAPGIGKTAICQAGAEEEGAETKILYLSMLDPVELYGLPVPVGEAGSRRVERLLDDLLLGIVEAKTHTMLLLDEIDKASASTQAAAGPLLLARRIGRHKLPDNVAIVATANRRSDRAGSQGILSHLISRFTCVTLGIDADSWGNWATKKGLAPETISFIRHRPALLHDFDAEKAVSGTAPYPCPRTWEIVAQHTAARVPADCAGIAYAGAVGEGAAAEYQAHLRLCAELPDLESALRDPGTLKLPKTVGGLYALVSGLANLASNNDRAHAVFAIAERMISDKKTEFAACLVRDCLQRHDFISSSPAWIAATRGKLGQVLTDV